MPGAAVLAIWLLVANGPARADLPPALAEALARFDALAAAERARGGLPRLADGEAAPVLRAIWAAAAADPAVPGDDIAAVVRGGAVESAELRVLDAYADFPAPSPVPTDYDGLVRRFGPELAGSLAASVAAAARLSAALEGFRAGHPAPDPERDAQRIAQLRLPSQSLVLKARELLASPAFAAADAATVAAAFADHGADFALLLGRGERDLDARTLEKLRGKLDAAAARDLGRFIEALRTAPCGLLCAVP